MNIEQLLEKGNVTLAFSASDLHEFGLSLIHEATASMQQSEKEEKMLSSKETAKLLGISENSLWRWGKLGYLVGIKIGRKVLYKQSDVDALIKG